MATTTVIDNEFASLWCDAEKKLVHHHIKKWVHGEDLRKLLLSGYEQLKKNGCTKWLSDDRFNGALKPDDETWAKTVWFPQVLQAGWKHWAIVLPEKIVGQMNIQRFSEDYKAAGINAKAFSDPDAALKWLESL